MATNGCFLCLGEHSLFILRHLCRKNTWPGYNGKCPVTVPAGDANAPKFILGKRQNKTGVTFSKTLCCVFGTFAFKELRVRELLVFTRVVRSHEDRSGRVVKIKYHNLIDQVD